MIGLLAALAVLTATPEVALVKRSIEGVSEETVAAVMRQITAGVQAQGLSVQTAKATCRDAKCLGDLSLSSKVAASIGVSIIRGRRDLTLDLEAIDGQQHQVALGTFGIPVKGEPLPADCAEFFRTLKLAVAPTPVADSPRVVKLEPTNEATPELVQSRSNSGLLRVSAGTTIAAGAVGLGLFLASAVVKVGLDGRLSHRSQSGVVMGITRDEAQNQANLSNGLINASFVPLAIAAVAAVTTVILYLRDSSPEAPVED